MIRMSGSRHGGAVHFVDLYELLPDDETCMSGGPHTSAEADRLIGVEVPGTIETWVRRRRGMSYSSARG